MRRGVEVIQLGREYDSFDDSLTLNIELGAKGKAPRYVVLNFSVTNRICAAFVGQLVLQAKDLATKNSELVLVSVNPFCQDILAICGGCQFLLMSQYSCHARASMIWKS